MNVNIGKKTPNASEKVLGSRKGNVSGAGRVTQVRDGEFREMISNLMEPSHPYLLPRTVPTSAGVIFHKPQMSIVKNLSEEPHGVVIIRPAVEKTVSLGVKHPTMGVRGVIARTPDHGKVMLEGSLCLSSKVYTSDNHYVLGEVVDNNNGFQYIERDGTIGHGYYVYPKMSWNAGATLTVQLKGEYIERNAVLNIRDMESSSNLASLPATSEAGNLTWVHTFNDPGVGELRIMVDNATSSSLSTAIQFAGFNVVEGFSFERYSLWDMLGNQTGASTSKDQYYAAERYSVTGFSALLSNTTANQYKSGSVVAAQLPGGSSHLIPGDPEKAYKFVSSYNDPKTHAGQLNKGIHWFFSPEKVQDWFYKDTRDLEGERPFLVVAWTGVAANDLANVLGLTLDIRINIELLTTDISLMKFMPTADLSRLMDMYITLVSAHNSVGENPEHRKKISKIVSDIAANPYVRNGLKLMREAGKVILPLALAAL